MTIRELNEFLDRRIPRSLSCAWDNDGLLCCPDPDRQIHRALVALDVTVQTVAAAVQGKYDLLLTHHPLIFRPIKALTPDSCVPRKLLQLAAAGISAIALHTRLDAIDGGVNDALAAVFDTEVIGSFPCEDALAGRIIRLPAPITAPAFSALVKARLGTDAVTLADAGRTVQTIGMVGGSGGDFIFAARAAGCDTYLTGEAGYHLMLDAAESGINVVTAGHFYTERPVCRVLRDLLLEADAACRIDIDEHPTLKIC